MYSLIYMLRQPLPYKYFVTHILNKELQFAQYNKNQKILLRKFTL